MFVYLDNSSTTRPYKEVIEAMTEAMTHRFGNPSALHKLGMDAETEIKRCKKQILGTLNQSEGEILFTSGGTEANNLAILGYARRIAKRKNHLITSKTEHKSVLEAFKALESEGYSVTYVDVDAYGRVNPLQVIEAVTEKTALISLMMVNNETGMIQPIEEICKALKKMEKPPVLHVDAVQAYGKVRIDLRKLGIDLLTASGHKIHGPKGIGFLYVKKGVQIEPLLYGGGQQSDLRPGTENTYAIAGLSKAIEITFNEFEAHNNHMAALRDVLRKGIETQIPEAILNTPKDMATAPHVLHVSFPKIRGEVLLHALETEGVYVSIGSACNSKVKKYSHVLEAMKLSTEAKEGAVRFSLGSDTTEDEIDYAVGVVVRCYQELFEIIRGR